MVQVLLFAVLAIELKRRAPNAHTFLEVVLVRYGKGAHTVYLLFSLLTNIVRNQIFLSVITDPIFRLLLPCCCWVVVR